MIHEITQILWVSNPYVFIRRYFEIIDNFTDDGQHCPTAILWWEAKMCYLLGTLRHRAQSYRLSTRNWRLHSAHQSFSHSVITIVHSSDRGPHGRSFVLQEDRT